VHPLVVGKPFLYRVDVHKDVFLRDDQRGRAALARVPRRFRRRSIAGIGAEIVAERKDVVIESASVLGNRLMLQTMKSASSGLEVRGLDGKLIRDVPLPGIGTVGGVVGDRRRR